MFKAIKDNKIIAICEKKEVEVTYDNVSKTISFNPKDHFPCLVYDEVIEDTEHSVDEYEHYQGEFLLKTYIPVEVYNEQIRQTRQSLFTEQADPLKLDYDEALARYGETDERTIEAKNTWLAKKDEIRADNPYINIEDTLPEEINDLQSTSNL